ncbi:MAG: hypothetical protein AAF481_12370 [Acidobacteriota bacterium]
MLLLDSPVEAAGLSFFRDHADPATFHLLPGTPRVTEGPGGGIELLRYRGTADEDEARGGFLRLAVDLEPPEEQVADARDEIAERFEVEPNIVPVVFDRGGVRLVILGTESPAEAVDTAATESGEGDAENGSTPAGRFVEQVLGSAAPSLFHHQHAIFSAPLTADGAVLAEAALDGTATPLLVIYDLTFSGLAQARGLRAEVDYRMAYDYLRTRLAADTLYLRADLDREAEALAREGHIRIEDVDYTGSDPTVLAEREEEIRKTLLELSEMLFFQPAAAPAQAETDSGEGPSSTRRDSIARGAFVLRAFSQEDEQTLTYDLRETSVQARRIAPQGAVSLANSATDWLREVDLLDPAAAHQGFEAFSLPGADWSGVDRVQLDLRVGDERRTLVLSQDEPRAATVLPAGEVEVKRRTLARPASDDLGEPPADTEFAPAPTRALLVEPEVAAQRRRLRIALGPTVLDRAERFEGRLSDGSRSLSLLLDAERREVAVAVWGRTAVDLTGTLALKDGGEVTVEGHIGPEQRHLLIQPPEILERRVRIVLADPLERLRSAFVELETLDGGEASRTGVDLTAEQPTAFWSVPPAADFARGYRYRLRTTARNAEVLQGEWLPAAGPLLVVGDTHLRLLKVKVVLLPTDGLAGANLRLTSLEPPDGISPTVEHFLEAGKAPVEMRIPFRGDAQETRYRMAGELFFTTEVRALTERELTDEVLVLPA